VQTTGQVVRERRRQRALPRVAVVHDYLTQRGGAERVVLAMMQAFPGATLHTTVYEPSTTFPEFAQYDVRTSWLNRVPAFRRDPRAALALLPAAVRSLEIDDVDLVLCSSSGWAHGVRTSAAKLVYCHNPARWIYQAQQYTARMSLPVRTLAAAARPLVRRWDHEAAHSADHYLVNSSVVLDRVRASYGIEGEVLHPPMSMDVHGPQSAVPGIAPGFHLAVGRARGYKNLDVTVEAFRRLPESRLVVVSEPLDVDLPANVTVTGRVTDEQMRWLYAHATALVATSHEDFGLTPVEANAFGKPAYVLRAGGYLDTLAEGLSGVFLEAPTADAIVEGVRRGDATSFDPDLIRAHADAWSVRSFVDGLDARMASVLQRRSAP
jgi:glycosyltransferase involved in cell wall biosynthesis